MKTNKLRPSDDRFSATHTWRSSAYGEIYQFFPRRAYKKARFRRAENRTIKRVLKRYQPLIDEAEDLIEQFKRKAVKLDG